ncbi:MAG: hypothetical protein AB8I08_00395 [Sandaracinaceae bacterium]
MLIGRRGRAAARVLLGLGWCLIAGQASAQDAEGGDVPAVEAASEGSDDDARMHFRLGRAYYDSGRFHDAAREFQLAYDASGRAALLYNLYVSHRDAGNLRESVDALRGYLSEADNIENRAQLTARLENMEGLLARQSGTTTVVNVAPDEHPDEEGEAQATATSTSTPAESSGGGGLWVPGFIIAGAGGAFIVVGAVLGGVALGEQGGLEEEFNCDADGVCDPGAEEAASSGAALAGAADGMLFGGLAVAATGIVLAFVLAESGDDVSAGAACTSDGCLAQVGGTF